MRCYMDQKSANHGFFHSREREYLQFNNSQPLSYMIETIHNQVG